LSKQCYINMQIDNIYNPLLCYVLRATFHPSPCFPPPRLLIRSIPGIFEEPLKRRMRIYEMTPIRPHLCQVLNTVVDSFVSEQEEKKYLECRNRVRGISLRFTPSPSPVISYQAPVRQPRIWNWDLTGKENKKEKRKISGRVDFIKVQDASLPMMKSDTTLDRARTVRPHLARDPKQYHVGAVFGQASHLAYCQVAAKFR
jgi:hypothetical protein